MGLDMAEVCLGLPFSQAQEKAVDFRRIVRLSSVGKSDNPALECLDLLSLPDRFRHDLPGDGKNPFLLPGGKPQGLFMGQVEHRAGQPSEPSRNKEVRLHDFDDPSRLHRFHLFGDPSMSRRRH